MFHLILFALISTALAQYGNQNSGYENAENSQPPPIVPPTSGGGDQQGYNSDGGPQPQVSEAPATSASPAVPPRGPPVAPPDDSAPPPHKNPPKTPPRTRPASPPGASPQTPPAAPLQTPAQDTSPPVVPPQYPSNSNYDAAEKANPPPNMSATGGDGLAYSNDVRFRKLRARRRF